MTERDQGKRVRSSILTEIEGWRENSTEGYSWHVALNNFHTYLPSDEYVEEGGRQIGRMVLIAGLMDTKNGDMRLSEQARSLNSELFLSQTPREFFGTIDATINSTPGVSLEEIKRLQTQYHKENVVGLRRGMTQEEEDRERKKIADSVRALHELYEYTLPLYVELRVKGYSHHDLTG